ncbi:MAG: hypothetical protein QXD48_01545 [Candidatus Aenigmatarchaeota archaeon]
MKITKRYIIIGIVILFILTIMNYFYYEPAIFIAKNQGTVLSDNWWDALNWIKNNTAECAVIATYWDPGHFITGIARRAAVFDGASQNSLLEVPINDTRDETIIENYDAGINHIVMYKNGKKITARIQDISTTLLTSNETLAIEILKNYMKPNCTEMYYIASSDLIHKSQWWSYFATWDPIEKGKMYVFYTIQLTQARPVPTQNAIAYTYAMGQSQAFVLYDINGTIKPYLQAGNQFLNVEKIFYFNRDGQGIITTSPDAEVKGLLWLDPSRQAIIFIQSELENALFTRMFFFNGAGLKHFEFIKQWGGEVKLFKVKFD